HGEHAKRGTGVVAAGMHTERYVMKVVEPVASSGEKGADVIGEPERTEDIDGGLRGAGRNVSLGNEHGDIGGKNGGPPDLHDARDQSGLFVETSPLVAAGVIGIVFEGEKGQVRETAVRLEIIDEAASPRRAPFAIGPDFDVLVLTGKNGPAQLEVGIDLMQS